MVLVYKFNMDTPCDVCLTPLFDEDTRCEEHRLLVSDGRNEAEPFIRIQLD